MKATDIKSFAELFILEDGKPIQLEKWQLKHIIDPVFYTLNTDGNRRYNLALCGMPKKNGKTTLGSLVGGYMLLGDGEPEPEVYDVAGDKDQAKIRLNQAVKAFKRSPVLLNEVKIYRDAIERKDGSGIYKVLSSDAPTAHGLNPHCVLWDELWNQRNYDLWEALTHSPARKQPLHFITTYAGYEQWEGNLLYDLYTRGLKKKDRRMWFYWTHKNHASWVTKEYLKQQRQRLPEHIYLRLHENRPTSGTGTFLIKDHVTTAISPDLENSWSGNEDFSYFCSLDLGLRRDRTAIAVTHKNEDGIVILDHLKTFEAPRKGEVRIEDVEEHILDLSERFDFSRVIFDPWQSVRTRQRLEESGLNVTEFTFSGSNWVRLTQNLFSLFRDGRIKIFSHKQLVKELLSVKIVEKSYGYRLDHDSGAHDDCTVALAMSALYAMQEDSVDPSIRFIDIYPQGGTGPDGQGGFWCPVT